MARFNSKLYAKGAKVRLRHDVTTRGGIRYRAGVVFTVGYHETKFVDLVVYVRAQYHCLRLQKFDVPRTCEVVAPADPNRTEDDDGA